MIPSKTLVMKWLSSFLPPVKSLIKIFNCLIRYSDNSEWFIMLKKAQHA